MLTRETKQRSLKHTIIATFDSGQDVANSYSIQQAVCILRYGSLININLLVYRRHRSKILALFLTKQMRRTETLYSACIASRSHSRFRGERTFVFEKLPLHRRKKSNLQLARKEITCPIHFLINLKLNRIQQLFYN